jgi:hypothetical protein
MSSHESYSRAAATISADGLYRYRLERWWNEDVPAVLFVMLNPSTADARDDDPTIRRCVGFARSWGAGGLLVGNLYALRATDPRGLVGVDDPVGPENDDHLFRMSRVAARTVVAWGAWPGPDRYRPARVMAALCGQAIGARAYALGRTKAGAPRHPLYLRADALAEPYRLPLAA